MNFEPRGALGVMTISGRIVPILDFQVPLKCCTVFTTTVDQQRQAVFEIYYRDNRTHDWLFLDSLALDHIHPAMAGDPDLHVEAELDRQGGVCLRIAVPAAAKHYRFHLRLEDLGSKCLETEQALFSSRTPAIPQAARGKGRIWPWVLAAISAVAVAAALYFLLIPQSRPSAEMVMPQKPMAASESLPPSPAKASEQAVSAQGVELQPSVAEPMIGAEPGSTSIAEPLPYSIIWGDVLWRISERFYGSRYLYRELAERNGLPDPDRIIAGESILLPPSLSGNERTKLPGEVGTR